MAGPEMAPEAWRVLREWAAEAPLTIHVSGNCMAPVLDDGDAVEVRSVSWYWPGDIVVVKGSPGAPPKVHRLLGGVAAGGWSRFMTQADDAQVPDGVCTLEQIVGRVTKISGSKRSVRIPWTIRLRSMFRFLGCVTGRFFRNNGLR